ncbi:MAG: protein translocase subunit SecF [Actinomycetota bacterium]|nr:protein translocase subunit SecF [Actinomycetota bacterium]
MESQVVLEKESLWSRLYYGHTNYSFVKNRRRWYTVSSIVILVGIGALFVRGLNFGIEFKGGTSWQVTNSSLTVSKAKSAISALGLHQAVIVSLGSGKNTTIEVQADLSRYPVSQRSTVENEVTADLAKAANVSQTKISLNDVGPTWGGEITSKAIRALIGFFIAISLYIALRFEVKMALAALVAVVHDILVTIGIYAIVGFDVTPATVIALLTILGYSLYDTIVVFDRVKENVKELVDSGKMRYSDGVDRSMNQVLMRSMNTSIVAIIPILSILIIGAEILGATTLQQFGLALFIGLTTGAYSSLFVASPILASLKEREVKYQQIASRVASREAKAEKAARAKTKNSASDPKSRGGKKRSSKATSGDGDVSQLGQVIVDRSSSAQITVVDEMTTEVDEDFDDIDFDGDDADEDSGAGVAGVEGEVNEGDDPNRVRPKLIEPGSRQLRSTSRRRR